MLWASLSKKLKLVVQMDRDMGGCPSLPLSLTPSVPLRLPPSLPPSLFLSLSVGDGSRHAWVGNALLASSFISPYKPTKSLYPVGGFNNSFGSASIVSSYQQVSLCLCL